MTKCAFEKIKEVKNIDKKGMSSKAASRIQSATAKANNGRVSKESFAARAQSAAAKKSK